MIRLFFLGIFFVFVFFLFFFGEGGGGGEWTWVFYGRALDAERVGQRDGYMAMSSGTCGNQA